MTVFENVTKNSSWIKRFLVVPNFASKRCLNLFFKGFLCSEVFFGFLWKNRKSARKVSSMQGCFENSNMQWEKLEKLRKVKWWKVNMRYVPIYLRQGLVILSLTSGTFLLHWLPLFGSSWRIGRGRVCNLTPHLLGCLYRSVVVGSWLGDVASAFSCVLGPDLMLTIEHCSFLGWN